VIVVFLRDELLIYYDFASVFVDFAKFICNLQFDLSIEVN
jgi:hypothetical protein